jgi:hypothetical protein
MSSKSSPIQYSFRLTKSQYEVISFILRNVSCLPKDINRYETKIDYKMTRIGDTALVDIYEDIPEGTDFISKCIANAELMTEITTLAKQRALTEKPLFVLRKWLTIARDNGLPIQEVNDLATEVYDE